MALQKDDKGLLKKETSIQGLLQAQVNHEFENERLYLSMALWASNKGYIETGKFFSTHALEERKHGMDFINFMLNKNMKPKAPVTTGIPDDFKDLGDMIHQAVKREFETTTLIRDLHKKAVDSSDHAQTISATYLQEQLEEEQLFLSVYNLYKLCGESKIDFEMEIGSIKKCDKYKLASI